MNIYMCYLNFKLNIKFLSFFRTFIRIFQFKYRIENGMQWPIFSYRFARVQTILRNGVSRALNCATLYTFDYLWEVMDKRQLSVLSDCPPQTPIIFIGNIFLLKRMIINFSLFLKQIPWCMMFYNKKQLRFLQGKITLCYLLLLQALWWAMFLEIRVSEMLSMDNPFIYVDMKIPCS